MSMQVFNISVAKYEFCITKFFALFANAIDNVASTIADSEYYVFHLSEVEIFLVLRALFMLLENSEYSLSGIKRCHEGWCI